MVFEKLSDKYENVEDQDTVMESSEKQQPAEEMVEQFVDVIDLNADDLIDSKNIVSIELPKTNIDMVNGKPVIVNSHIMVTLRDNPRVCSNLIQAAHKGVINFRLTTYMDIEKTEVCDVWEFEGAKVSGINFGQIVTTPLPEQRVVQCEIEFTKLSINGIKI